jgi:hypothetical protein
VRLFRNGFALMYMTKCRSLFCGVWFLTLRFVWAYTSACFPSGQVNDWRPTSALAVKLDVFHRALWLCSCSSWWLWLARIRTNCLCFMMLNAALIDTWSNSRRCFKHEQLVFRAKTQSQAFSQIRRFEARVKHRLRKR